MKRIAILVGSLRNNSYSLQTAKALMALAPAKFAFEIVEIGQLPLYNQDYDGASPQSYVDFRAKIATFDAVLFVTPEHNRSFPAALKNALDVGSRPYGASAWSGKPAGVVSVSIGAIGGFGAHHHLRQVLVFLNMPTMPQPEAYLGSAIGVFDEKGNVKDEAVVSFLTQFITAFAAWVDQQTSKGQPLLNNDWL